MLPKVYWCILVICLNYGSPSAAQSTTGGLFGSIQTITKNAIVAATIQLIHVPSGTHYYTQTNSAGYFQMTDVNPGGPYTIEISHVGYIKEKRTGLFIKLGALYPLTILLTESDHQLANIVVKARKKAMYLGDESTRFLTEEKLDQLPTVGRNMHDYLRSLPQARLISSNENAVSFAGHNNRFNAFYIDGAVNNDVFGLSPSGTNGGQAGISPISFDAVQQIQVNQSPVDAAQGNFTGAGINTITRAGTNRSETSIYYSYSNEFLTGNGPVEENRLAEKWKGYLLMHGGMRMQGAIQKNKIFYFFNFDWQKEDRPQPFAFSNYKGDTRNLNTLKILSNNLETMHDYAPGDFLSNTSILRADRFIGRLDMNLGLNNKLTLSYRYNNGSKEQTNASTPTLIQFRNNGYFLSTTTQSVSAELKTVNGKNSGNKLILSYTGITDNRDPLGRAFPRVRIYDGEGSILFGTDINSTNNYLQQHNISVLNKYQFITGKHLLNAGIDLEYHAIANSFIQQSFGSYSFFSLSDFILNKRPADYQLGYSSQNSNKNEQLTATRFSAIKSALFLNDQLSVTQNLTFFGGVRIDRYFFMKTPDSDEFVKEIALPAFSNYYALPGTMAGAKPFIPISVSPRIGFHLLLSKKSLSIRGGVGIFSGRMPLAWPGGIYQFNGKSVGGYEVEPAQLSKIRFRANPHQQWTPAELGVLPNAIPLNLIDDKLSMPKAGKAWLNFELDAGNGWLLHAEYLYSKNLQEINYTNINILPPIAKALGPDERPVYAIANKGRIPIGQNGINPYDHAILLSNYAKETGSAISFTSSISNRFTGGLLLEAKYNYIQSSSLQDGTFSVNLSQWRLQETVTGRNQPVLSASDFSTGHKVFILLHKRFAQPNQKKSCTVSLSYTGQSGSLMSFVYGNRSMVRDDGIAGNYDLIYIPTKNDITQMIFLPLLKDGVTYGTMQQKEALENYILQDNYLNKNRGRYAERNSNRLPFTHSIDLKIKEEFLCNFSGIRFRVQITLDIFNLANMLNPGFGIKYDMPGDHFPIIKFAGFISENNYTPQFQFDPTVFLSKPWLVSKSLSPAYAARWMGQLGFRLIF